MLSETKQNPCLPFRSLFATPHVYTEDTRSNLIRSDGSCRMQMQVPMSCEYQLLFKRLLLFSFFFFFDATTFRESRRKRLLVANGCKMIFLRARIKKKKKKNVRSFIYIVCRFKKSCDATIRRRFLVCLSDANFAFCALSTNTQYPVCRVKIIRQHFIPTMSFRS